MTWTVWAALVIVVLTIYGLIKRRETRFVLLLAGLAMTLIAMEPLEAFRQFDKSMTTSSLIVAICSAIGFAAVMSLTKCDMHLVALLTKPLRSLGIFLLPCTMVVLLIINLGINSFSGFSAAVGPTIICLLVRAGFKPAMAAATVACSCMAAYLSPATPHHIFVAQLEGIPVMDYILLTAPRTLTLCALSIVSLTVLCIILRDYDKTALDANHAAVTGAGSSNQLPTKPNILMALAPMVPVAILLAGAVWFPQLKLSVCTAMLFGMIYAIVVTRSNPETVVKKFFEGLGNGYGSILGIIIAAGVFAAGLRACGVIDLFIETLKSSNEIAKVGATFGPFFLGLITGSGDAATFAFNEAVTPHAHAFGMEITDLGYLATMAGGFGRYASPLAGGMIILSGIAMVSPFEVCKRSMPVMLVLLVAIYIMC